jgi:PAS domain S-box-containing protein
MAGETGQGGLIGDLLQAVRRHLDMDVAFVSEFTGGRRVFRFVDAAAEDDGLLVPGTGDPLEATYCARIVDGLLPEVIPDTSLEPLALEIPGTVSLPVGSHIGVPITFPDGRLYGTLCCFSHAPADLDRRDRLALALVADVVAAHLRRVEEHLAESVAVQTRVEAVIDDEQFFPVFQPIVDLQSGRVVGAEALTRFTAEPARSPDKWFAEAATVGLGGELQRITLRRALDHIDELPPGAYLSVNVSPSLLSDAAPLLRSVDGTRLVVELTEHEEIADYDALTAASAELRTRGIRFAIDDAGAGYSSLTHVLRLLPDIVKLDISITRGADTDLARQALARALVEFAGKLGATVVAEGVETAAELRTLAGLGVACGQGYHMARPGPLPLPDAIALEPITTPVVRTEAIDAIHFAFMSNPLPLALSTVDGRFVEVNDAVCRLFGRDVAEFPGRSWRDLNPAGDAEATAAAFGAVLAGEADAAVLHTSIARPDGTEVGVRLTGRLVRDAQGRPLWFANELLPLDP